MYVYSLPCARQGVGQDLTWWRIAWDNTCKGVDLQGYVAPYVLPGGRGGEIVCRILCKRVANFLPHHCAQPSSGQSNFFAAVFFVHDVITYFFYQPFFYRVL